MSPYYENTIIKELIYLLNLFKMVNQHIKKLSVFFGTI